MSKTVVVGGREVPVEKIKQELDSVVHLILNEDEEVAHLKPDEQEATKVKQQDHTPLFQEPEDAWEFIRGSESLDEEEVRVKSMPISKLIDEKSGVHKIVVDPEPGDDFSECCFRLITW